jgi:hypothetical protein
MARIFEVSGGIARLINSVCEMSLVTAYVGSERCVMLPAVDSAIKELGFGEEVSMPLLPRVEAVGKSSGPNPGRMRICR